MDNTPGCKRMIFIRSGNYDYAEVDFDRAIHLVGRNNVGKTSLISALQFLFIGDQSDMRFDGYTMDDTRRYYFKHPTSYILFECLSAETHSYVTVGLRGYGPIGGYRIERFAFPGRFDRQMFITANQNVRDFDDIKFSIVQQREVFRLLEPKDLRAALTGTWEERKLNLGIVPLRDGTTNERFVHLFRNLLKLNKMEQEAIKQTLVEIYRREFTKPAIDCQKDHEASFSKLESERTAIDRLTRIRPQIEALAAARDAQSKSRLILKPLYRALIAARAAEEARLEIALAGANKVLSEFGEKQTQLKTETMGLTTRRIDIGSTLTDIAKVNEAIRLLAIEFKHFVPELENEAVRNLEEAIGQLQGKLYNNTEPASIIQTDIVELKRQLDEAKHGREHFDKLLGSQLAKIVGENQIRDVFKILNPKLLMQGVGEDGVRITDQEQLTDALAHIDRLIDLGENRFSGHGIAVPLGPLGRVASLPNLEHLDDQIASLTKKLAERAAQLEVALNQNSLRKTLADRQKELKERSDRLRRHGDYIIKLGEASARAESEARLIAQRDALEKRDQEISAAQTKLMNDSLASTAQQRQFADEQTKLLQYHPPVPDDSWPEAPPTDSAGAFGDLPYAALLDRYRSACATERDATELIRNSLATIEVVLQDGYPGHTPEEKAAAAIDSLGSLAARQQSYDTLWNGLVTEIKSSIKEMLGDVERLKDKVQEFNRRLGTVQISNLKRVSMDIVENRDRIKTYQQLFNEGGIFGETPETKLAVDAVAKLIRGSDGKVTLHELFGIEFVVEYANGSKKHFAKLDAIESNGTTIMIKALVNIMLMRDMMKKNRPFSIPFYLDEANQIDETNLKGLATIARSLGFTPVLASTMPVAVAETLYFVQWTQEGRAVLDAKDRIRREVPPEPNTVNELEAV